ncbi:hypothetical protein DPMN_147508 [Dreissena polymorpha]|uniref:Uncharacterized protein n=1 Tax=Dreissena polymorpha TaxID=45954 RepID=A0A9D4FCA5_DREPO|nr:hypothetical protein DPMN_147455 [Dreissena polymorpha]KAH3793980.1 hypothetical protein DPMN_147508 [Dreissena polymorpha]
MIDAADGAVILAQLEIAFFGKGTISNWVYSLYHLFSSQIFGIVSSLLQPLPLLIA